MYARIAALQSGHQSVSEEYDVSSDVKWWIWLVSYHVFVSMATGIGTT